MQTPESPKTVFVLFGATGDLTQKKVLPALYHLFRTGYMPSGTLIIALGRTAHTENSFKDFVAHHVEKILNEKPDDAFLSRFSYVSGDVNDMATYGKLEQVVVNVQISDTASVVLYLSVSAELYTPISSGVTAHTSLLKRAPAKATVCIEKPLGSDLKSAQLLDTELSNFFSEDQIYRIEHYLAKPFIQHVPVFRFKEGLYEDLFSRHSVKKIDVFFSEKMGVENRGSFYDSVGAFRDVGQNHCLHMLASVCADKPESDTLESIIASRASFLENTLFATDLSVVNSYRAQYDGYTTISGVSQESHTETAFEIHTALKGERWLGVPVTLSGGKRMAEYKTGVLLTFNHNPKEIVSIYFESHPKMQITVTFSDGTQRANYVSDTLHVQYVGEYAAIIHEIFAGKKMFSITEREVEAMWKFVDPYCIAWRENRVLLAMYAPDTLTLPLNNS